MKIELKMQLTDDQIKTLKLAQRMIADVYGDVPDAVVERALSAADSCLCEAIDYKIGEIKEYCVDVKVYVYAWDSEDAVNKVISDMKFLVDEKSDGDIIGFKHPRFVDAEECEECVE